VDEVAQAPQGLREGTTREMRKSVTARRRRDVPRPRSSDWKRSVADGWKAGASNNKRQWRGRAETPTGLDIRRLHMTLVTEETPVAWNLFILFGD